MADSNNQVVQIQLQYFYDFRSQCRKEILAYVYYAKLK